MKIALFSDIHANYPALEAFFVHLKEENPDMVFCLGDLVGYNSYVNEVIHLIRSKNISALCGNHDYYIARLDKNFKPDYQNPFTKLDYISTQYTNSVLDDEGRKYLRYLPLQIKLNFEIFNRAIVLLLVHGSAVSIDELLFETTPDDYLLNMMNAAGADIMCFGHTHKPYHKKFELLKEKFPKHAINIGSIGKPKDGDPRGCYTILDLNVANKENDGIQVKFMRFEYDIEKAIEGIKRAQFPSEWGEMLRHAY